MGPWLDKRDAISESLLGRMETHIFYRTGFNVDAIESKGMVLSLPFWFLRLIPKTEKLFMHSAWSTRGLKFCLVNGIGG